MTFQCQCESFKNKCCSDGYRITNLKITWLHLLMQIRYLSYRFMHSYCMYLISKYLKHILSTPAIVMESTDDPDCQGHLYMEKTQVWSLEMIWTHSPCGLYVSFSIFNLEFPKYKNTLIFNQKHLLLIPYNGKVASPQGP